MIVKGGPTANVYAYPAPGAKADTGLAPPLNPNNPNERPYGLSNLTFCYDTPVELQSEISGRKYFDADGNGVYSDGDTPIPGWLVDYTDENDVTKTADPTDADGFFVVKDLPKGIYFFKEQLSPGWKQTGNTDNVAKADENSSVKLDNFIYEVDLAENGEVSGLDFGNVCLGAGNGKTLGFWSNRNGLALFGDDDRLTMVGLNLRNANGTNFDPASYSDFRTWLLGASATNMAYMLSAQMAAMQLNVDNGLVDGGALLDGAGVIPGIVGFPTVQEVIDAANALLGSKGSILAGDSDRPYATALKDLLDRANNNQNFVMTYEYCMKNYPPFPTD